MTPDVKTSLPPLVQHDTLDDPRFINQLQQDNWISKYRFNGENLEEYFWRIAYGAASVEKTDELREHWANEYYSILDDFQFTVGGRISANIGTGLASKTMMNCYINGPVTNAKIEYTRTAENGLTIPCEINTPSTPDNLFNIFLTILEQGKTLASDGGYGTNFSWLRPRGAMIEGIGIEHPGAVAYMEIWDIVSSVIVRGNNDGYVDELENLLTPKERKYWERVKQSSADPRKGAQMFILNVDHPDIEEFIKVKRESGKLTKANLSVGITDKFMKAVEKDKMWELKFDGIIYKRLRAKDLYNLIMESSWKYNDPGVVFLDNMNKFNPIAYLGECDATNPCGEIPGNPLTSTVCLLGSINLTRFVSMDENGKPQFDWRGFERAVSIASRLLDAINDLEVSMLPQYRWAVKNLRQFGMGINGFGSACAMLGIDYGNNRKCIKFAEDIARTKFYECWSASCSLAEEKGPFPAYNTDEFCNSNFFQKKLKNFPDLQKRIRQHGVRNAKCTTNPPLGNSMILCGNVSNGIEPIFSDQYDRAYITTKWPEGITKDNIKDIFTAKEEGKDTVWEGTVNKQKYFQNKHI